MGSRKQQESNQKETLRLGEKRGWQKAKEDWKKDQEGMNELKRKVGEEVKSDNESDRP